MKSTAVYWICISYVCGDNTLVKTPCIYFEKSAFIFRFFANPKFGQI